MMSRWMWFDPERCLVVLWDGESSAGDNISI